MDCRSTCCGPRSAGGLSRIPQFWSRLLRVEARFVWLSLMRFSLYRSSCTKFIISLKTRGIRFILTGSSARKLKKETTNMLGGRATSLRFTSFSWKELSDAGVFDLARTFNMGVFPVSILDKIRKVN